MASFLESSDEASLLYLPDPRSLQGVSGFINSFEDQEDTKEGLETSFQIQKASLQLSACF